VAECEWACFHNLARIFGKTRSEFDENVIIEIEVSLDNRD